MKNNQAGNSPTNNTLNNTEKQNPEIMLDNNSINPIPNSSSEKDSSSQASINSTLKTEELFKEKTGQELPDGYSRLTKLFITSKIFRESRQIKIAKNGNKIEMSFRQSQINNAKTRELIVLLRDVLIDDCLNQNVDEVSLVFDQSKLGLFFYALDQLPRADWDKKTVRKLIYKIEDSMIPPTKDVLYARSQAPFTIEVRLRDGTVKRMRSNDPNLPFQLTAKDIAQMNAQR